MTDPSPQRRPMTIEAYLEFEDASDVRHEYVGGDVYAMTGGTRRHNRIAGNLFARLWTAVRDSPCRVYISDVKLRAAADVIYYPDLIVACRPDHDDPLVERDPCLIVEVISPSTEMVDRREKAFVYKAIGTLQAYLLVDQDRRRVVRYWRDAEGNWQQGEVTDASETRVVPVPCPALDLTLAEIYEDVELGTPPNQPRRVRETAPA